MRTTPYHQGRQLGREELRDARQVCPACGSMAPRTPVHCIQEEPRVELLACGFCGIASASWMPTEAALEATYANYYAAGEPQHTFAGVERFGAHIAQWVPAGSRRLRILDFGGGAGELSFVLAQALLRRDRLESCEVQVVDPTPVMVSTEPRIQMLSAPDLEACSGPFDLVLASAILEHIPDVGAVMRRLAGLMATGAIFYARTPWWAPLMRLLPRVDMTFPAHVHDMGAAFWNQAADRLELPLELVASQPSIVETALGSEPLRTVAAHLLKAPSRLEVRLRRRGWTRAWWPWVGGWEAVFVRSAGESQ